MSRPTALREMSSISSAESYNEAVLQEKLDLPVTSEPPSPSSAGTLSPESKKRGSLVQKSALTSERVLLTGEKISDMYDIDIVDGLLGSGAYGTVYAATSKAAGVQRAMKWIAKDRLRKHVADVTSFVHREFDILKNLDHPNIIRIYEMFEDSKYIYITEDLCRGGDLLDRVLEQKRLGEPMTAHIMRQVLSAVHYLHNHGVVHRDIKPENFLFVSRDIMSPLKLIDFGLSKKVFDSRHTTREEGSKSNVEHRLGPMANIVVTPKVGTPVYMAPEITNGSLSQYTKEVDVWSCGILAHVVLTGRFPGTLLYSDPEQYFKLWGSMNGLSPETSDFVHKMVKLDPAARASLASLLSDPWLNKSHELRFSARPAPTLKLIAKSNRRSTSTLNLSESSTGDDIYGRLVRYSGESALKRVALNAIARDMTDDEIMSMREAFMRFDRNNDGVLTVAELVEGLATCPASDREKMAQIFESIDVDSSGEIDYTEFIAACLSRRKYARRDVLWRAFQKFDKDGSGKISLEELDQILNGDADTAGFLKKDRQEIKALMAEVDENGDGEIDFDEFMHMMDKTQAATTNAKQSS